MKKMYFLTVLLIAAIVIVFLLFSCDEDELAKEFLSGYGICTEQKPYSAEDFIIPEEFDSYYDSYNMMQMESNLNLSPYKGKRAVRRTYRITNFFKDFDGEVFANVIFVNRRPVAGDINCPTLDGFILPLSYMLTKGTK